MQILLYFLVGCGSGLVSALCGVGGGIVLVPVFVILLGLGQKMAVATSLAVIIPTALAATAGNFKGGLIDWKLVLPVALGASLAAWFGSDLMRSMESATLKRIFGVVLLLAGAQMLWKG